MTDQHSNILHIWHTPSSRSGILGGGGGGWSFRMDSGGTPTAKVAVPVDHFRCCALVWEERSCPCTTWPRYSTVCLLHSSQVQRTGCAIRDSRMGQCGKESKYVSWEYYSINYSRELADFECRSLDRQALKLPFQTHTDTFSQPVLYRFLFLLALANDISRLSFYWAASNWGFSLIFSYNLPMSFYLKLKRRIILSWAFDSIVLFLFDTISDVVLRVHIRNECRNSLHSQPTFPASS